MHVPYRMAMTKPIIPASNGELRVPRSLPPHPVRPDATLLVQKEIIHQGQGLAGDVGDIPFAYGGEGRREIEGQHEGRDEVAPQCGIDRSSPGTVQGSTLLGASAADNKFGQVNQDRLASNPSV